METVTTEFIEFLEDRLDMDEEEAAEFASDLEDHGIETKERFEESYQGYIDEYFAERAFAKYFYIEMEAIGPDNPLYSFIDWQDVWDSNLCYDYFEINGHFFRNI